jgi:hypothetical protein
MGAAISRLTGSSYGLGAAAFDVASGCIGIGALKNAARLATLSKAVKTADRASDAARAAQRARVGDLIKDATDSPENWKTVGTFTEDAVNAKARGGVSIQTIVENEQGERLVRHTVLDKAGKVIDDHYRPMYKPRDVDKP